MPTPPTAGSDDPPASACDPPPGPLQQVVRTLVLYALAEHQLGHATTLRVTATGTAFTVEDDGRGHGLDRTVHGRPYVDLIYGHLDYPHGDPVPGPVQLQGLGLSLANRLCRRLDVTVRRGGESLHLGFAQGRRVRHARRSGDDGLHGVSLSGEIDGTAGDGPDEAADLGRWLGAVQATHPGLRLWWNGRCLAGDEGGGPGRAATVAPGPHGA